VVHIYFLIGFRNRWSVFRQWAYTYLFLNDGARLITGSQELPGWVDHSGVPEPMPVGPLDLGSPQSNRGQSSVPDECKGAPMRVR
jgi:NADH dehydrogenase